VEEGEVGLADETMTTTTTTTTTTSSSTTTHPVIEHLTPIGDLSFELLEFQLQFLSITSIHHEGIRQPMSSHYHVIK